MAKTYTIADLCALPGDALDAMAAELRGWRLGGLLGKEEISVWCTGEKPLHDNYERQIRISSWYPTEDRNQSGELLKWATANCHKFSYSTFGSALFSNVRVEWVSEPSMEFRSLKVIGNDARAETIAFCAAMLAMAGRLKGE